MSQLVTQGIIKASPLLFLVLAGAGIFWGIREDLYADPGFSIQKIEIVPEGALAPEQRSELERLYLSKNLFRVTLGDVKRTVEKDPKIKKARVVREFPKTLRIEIGERKAFAQVQINSQNLFYWVAEDGIVLNRETKRNKELIYIDASEIETTEAQVAKELRLRGLKEAMGLTKMFWSHTLARSEKIEHIRLDHLGNVSIALVNGPELRFGSQPSRKFQRVENIIPLIQGEERKQIVYIDLQYQDLIVKKKT